MSKTRITQRLDGIRRHNEWEAPLDCPDAAFVLDVLELHPEFDLRTGGRDNVCCVTTGQADYGTVCFYVSRCDRPRPLVKVSVKTALEQLDRATAAEFWGRPHACE